jgi:hypothetical protein
MKNPAEKAGLPAADFWNLIGKVLLLSEYLNP